MRQGWKVLAALALSSALLAATPPVSTAATRNGAGSEAAQPSKRTAGTRQALRQFTGYVTAVDPSSLTIEKRGKNPQSRVFLKHDEMRATGDIEKDARVTVFYRDEGGRAIAHRVVARPARPAAKRSK